MPEFSERIEHRVTAKLPSGVLEVAVDTVTLRDGEELARSTHRHVLEPGDPIDGEPADVVAVATLLWTDARRAAYDTIRTERQAALEAIPAEAAG
jgi:hypothetical protein